MTLQMLQADSEKVKDSLSRTYADFSLDSDANGE